MWMNPCLTFVLDLAGGRFPAGWKHLWYFAIYLVLNLVISDRFLAGRKLALSDKPSRVPAHGNPKTTRLAAKLQSCYAVKM